MILVCKLFTSCIHYEQDSIQSTALHFPQYRCVYQRPCEWFTYSEEVLAVWVVPQWSSLNGQPTSELSGRTDRGLPRAARQAASSPADGHYLHWAQISKRSIIKNLRSINPPCVPQWTVASPRPSTLSWAPLSFISFEQAVLQPPPWQHVERRLPASSSFQCPCLSLCGLISPDELSQPQQVAQCLLNRDRSLCCAAVMGTHCTGTLPPSPPTNYLFSVQSQHLLLLPSCPFSTCPLSRKQQLFSRVLLAHCSIQGAMMDKH